MFEAILCAAAAFIYAVFICFSSMGVSILFGRTLDLLIVGHVIVLIVFCGGGLGFVGWCLGLRCLLDLLMLEKETEIVVFGWFRWDGNE